MKKLQISIGLKRFWSKVTVVLLPAALGRQIVGLLCLGQYCGGELYENRAVKTRITLDVLTTNK